MPGALPDKRWSGSAAPGRKVAFHVPLPLAHRLASFCRRTQRDLPATLAEAVERYLEGEAEESAPAVASRPAEPES